MLHRVIGIAGSAVLFRLYSQLEWGWAWLGFVVLMPWLYSLRSEQGVSQAVASGAAMSVAFSLCVFSWFAEAFARYTQTPLALALFLLAITAPLLQPQFVLASLATQVCHKRNFRGVPASVGVALVWVAAEWAFPRLFGDTLGHGLLPYATLRQAADLAGAPGLTAVLLVVNQELLRCVASEDTRRTRLRTIVGVVGVLLALFSYGHLRLRSVSQVFDLASPFRAVLVQANLGDYRNLRERPGSAAAVREILAAHMRLVASGSPEADLILWPETVYPTTFGQPKSAGGAELDTVLTKYVADRETPLLFGTYDRDRHGEYNAAALVAPSDGTPSTQWYRKRRLFPLTEYVPAWLDGMGIRRFLPWLGTWRPGLEGTVFEIDWQRRELRLAPLICLDAVDPALAIEAARDGADLLVSLSNDGWFAGGAGARLHLAVAAFRSIETRLPQIRVTNTGISAVIDAGGEVVARTSMGQVEVLRVSLLPGRRAGSLMLLWGDWFGMACCLFVPFTFVAAGQFKTGRRE